MNVTFAEIAKERPVVERYVKILKILSSTASVTVLLVASPAMAQPVMAPPVGDAATTYRTLLALIEEMVDEKLISREKADRLIADAQAKASPAVRPGTSAQVASAPSPGLTLPPIEHRSPDSNKSAPVRQGNIQISSEQNHLPPDIQADWSRGAPVLSSRDGRFSFKPRGRILADFQTTSGSNFDARNISVSGLRQFRFGAVGTLGQHIFYQFEVDYRRNQTEVTNTFVGYRQRIGKVDADIRAGSLLTDRGMEVATAATADPFINLNVNSTALAPGGRIFLMGVSARAGAKNWHASLAIHGDPVDADYARSDSRIFMGRAHWNPILTDTGLIHLGGWAYDERVSRATAASTTNTINSGFLNTNIRVESPALTRVRGSQAFGLEAGGTYRSAYLFAEYGERAISFLPGAPIDHAHFKALSINSGFWLTGEKPTYASRSGTYVAPNIRSPLMGDGGMGGVELVGRYETLDYRSTPGGGSGSAITLGTNWYFTNYFRLMFNYIRWRTNNRTGSFQSPDTGDTLAARAEIAF
ncbi:OprO/OprP family phosphate-selective porin [Sphingobium sp. CCH11-B1]|uniref:OprO/OprP family phosphate-selective porin n=1 Tax=Sphingobium sp. CCH11-B1 TaxID=1768781 RepID=UPI0008324E0B|nr:porin [Sphingobium sp. CCH11-B1]